MVGNMGRRLPALRRAAHDRFSFGNFYPRNSPTTPMTDATTPPSNIQIALSVGDPVKKREMSEVNDVDAMTPNTISRIPPARRASETALLMLFPLMPN
jgi:hypothetical protein